MLEVAPDGVVDDVPVDDGVELHAANMAVVAASAATALAIRGRKHVVMRKSSSKLNENENRFRLTIEHNPGWRTLPPADLGVADAATRAHPCPLAVRGWHDEAVTIAPPSSGLRVGSMHVLVAGAVVAALSAGALRALVAGHADLSTAGTVFCGVFVQALPFLGLGVVVSGLIAVFVSPERLARWLPRRTGAAILAAGVSGAALPGCECGSVPVARRLFGDGGAGAAALTFMLAAPAVNPVVLVATAVAFPGQPAVVAARGIASLLTALIMGAAWSRWGHVDWITRRLPAADTTNASKWTVFTEAARHDFLQAASYLVLGAAAAAAMHVLVPPVVFTHLAGHLVLGVVTMALLAVVLALCSEADAFVASSLTMLPLVPRLVFLVVGPAVDVKLFAMQTGMFGRAFATRFAPATFVVATFVATAVGLMLLGGGR